MAVRVPRIFSFRLGGFQLRYLLRIAWGRPAMLGVVSIGLYFSC